MFKIPQILNRSCSLRPLLVSRETCVAAFSKHTAAGWQDARAATEKRYEATTTSSSTSSLEVTRLDCDYGQHRKTSLQDISPKAVLSSHHPLSQVSAPAIIKLSPHPRKCSEVKDLGQNVKAVRTLKDFLYIISLVQPWKRPRDTGQLSFSVINKTRCDLLQSPFYHRQHFVRPFTSLTHTAWSLSHCHSRARLHRAVHQAVPGRDCLSLENEARCRQTLQPNVKLYESDKAGKGANQGKNQAKWASVLVSLCSVEGEPAFLFTLRSSTLKGRHKGDVSFAGGKADPSDRDVVATALREAREELGFAVAPEKVWGILKPLRDMSGMMIAPVLANLGPLEDLSFKPNPAEVEEVFTMSLSHLCNPQNCGYTHFRVGDKYGYTLPVFRNGKHRVWGLTAVALSQALKLIVPP